MEEVTVRPENSDDVRAIDVVHMSAFAGEAEANLVNELRGSQYFLPALSLVAEIANRIVGHALVSRARLESREGERAVAVLGPMSVLPSQSHRGIGTALVEAAVQGAREQGFGALVVSGFPDYYKRLGFQAASHWGLTCSLPIPEYAVTAMELQEGYLNGGGHVVYPSAFIQVFQEA